MNQTLSFSLVIALLTVTTSAFAALFAWQYLENKHSNPSEGNNGNSPISTSNECPYYPVPQSLDFSEPAFQDLFKDLDDYIASTSNATTRPSVAANLVYNDKVIWTGYFGQLNKSTTIKPNKDTIYRIGSVSKVFPVIFLFKLWEEGKLNIYDPIEKYAPDFKIIRPYETHSKIRLIDIASQVSGLPNALPYDLRTGSVIIFNGSLEDAFKLLEGEVLVAEPRTKCVYSNIAYAMLADILARNFTSDRDFVKWAKQNIVEVLGMQNTGFHITEEIKQKMATGYMPDGSAAPIYDMLWYGPAGNYYSTADDMAKLSMSFLETSTTVLKHETITEIFRPRRNCKVDYFTNYTGSPWEMTEIDSYMVIQKLGGLEGYSASMTLVPDLKLAFNILTSGTRKENVGVKAIGKAVAVFKNALRKKSPILKSTPSPSKYNGLYNYYNLQLKNITVDDQGRLYMEDVTGPDNRLKKVGLSYVSHDTFTLQILGGEFPCVYKSTVYLGMQHGTIVHFKNFTGGVFRQIDFPELAIYGFKRVQ